MLVLVMSPCLLPSRALDTAVPALFLEYPIQRVAERVHLQPRWQTLEYLLPYVIILLDLRSLLQAWSHDRELRMN